MLLGIPYAFAITGKWGDEAIHAWRVAHTGVSAAGVAILVIGAAAAPLSLGEGAALLLCRSMLLSGYAFTVGLSLAAAGGVRGLQPNGPAVNVVTFAIDAVASLAAFVGVLLVVRGASAESERR
jgi:hypothetical protein